jgi:hypothetical protein
MKSKITSATVITMSILTMFWNSAQICDAKQKLQNSQFASTPQEFTLQRLKKADSLWTVIEDPEVKECIKTCMGSDIQKYFAATQEAELPDVKGDDLYSLGFVKGLCTIKESFLDLNLRTRKACIAVLDCNQLKIYGADSANDLPEPMILYIDDLKSRKAGEQRRDFGRRSETKPCQHTGAELALAPVWEFHH